MPEMTCHRSNPAERFDDCPSTHYGALRDNRKFGQRLKRNGTHVGCGMDKTIGQSLSDLRIRSGMTLNAIARAAGYSGPSSVQAYFHAAYDPPRLDVGIAMRLADALAGAGNPPITNEDIFKFVRLEDEPSSELIAPATGRRNFLDSDVPVYETRPVLGQYKPVEQIPGLSLTLANFETPLRYYPRAAGLSWNPKAFAIHMVGHAMSPRFRDGEPLFISRSRSPVANDDVMVVLKKVELQTETQPFSLIGFGRFVEQDYLRLAIVQYGTERTVSVKNNQIERVERIAAWAEVCGLPVA